MIGKSKTEFDMRLGEFMEEFDHKEQPMSDTLREGEDTQQHERIGGEYRCNKCRAEFKTIADFDKHKCVNGHQVTKSGTCVIPRCPCRGWSAQETTSVEESSGQRPSASDYHLFRPSQFNAHRCQVCGEYESYLAHGTTGHQPAARGGGDGPERIWIDCKPALVQGYRYIYLEPPDPDLPIQSNEYVSANQHQSLVAERERLAQAATRTISRLDDLPRYLHANGHRTLGDVVAECLIELGVALDQKGGPR